MTRLCPNCGHVRRASEAVPEWQCPSCGKAYNKGAGAANELPRLKVDSDRKRGRWLIACVVVASAAWAGKLLWTETARQQTSAQAAASTEATEVVLYSTQWCGYCAAARRFMDKHGVPYTELDIEKSTVAHDAYRRLGGKGVPLIVIDEQIVYGYDEARLRTLLASRMRPG